MRKMMIVNIFMAALLILGACASNPVSQVSAPAPKVTQKPSPVSIDFGPYWKGTVRVKETAKSDIGNNAEAQFNSEWTLGENAGNVYPKTFTLSNSGKTVKMNFLWDDGGDIPAGTYNVAVDIDGMPGSGKINNLKLSAGTAYDVYIDFKAAKIDIDLKTDGDEVITYPQKTYEKYKKLGRLNNIPKELAINAVSSYTDGNPIYWLIPAGIPLDIVQKHSDGTEEWHKNFIATPESFIKKLQ